VLKSIGLKEAYSVAMVPETRPIKWRWSVQCKTWN